MDVLPAIRTALSRVSPERLRVLREMPYVEYLSTPEWRRRRDARIRLANHRCQRCDGRHDLQVHHLSYERLGDEWDTDLEVLCRPCHESHHFDESRRAHIGIYVKLASEALKAGARGVPDLMGGVRERCAALKIPARDRAISRAVDVVLERTPTKPPTHSAFEWKPDRPIGRAEAEKICRDLRILVPFKSIPKAPWSDPDAFARALEAREALDRDL